MKKFILSLILGLVLAPESMFANTYYDYPPVYDEPPFKMPALYRVYFYLDHETGDYVICPNYNVTDLQITITQYGVVLEDTTVSLSAGQPFMGTFNGYAVGEYYLTLTTSDGDTICQYRITVLDD